MALSYGRRKSDGWIGRLFVLAFVVNVGLVTANAFYMRRFVYYVNAFGSLIERINMSRGGNYPFPAGGGSGD